MSVRRLRKKIYQDFTRLNLKTPGDQDQKPNILQWITFRTHLFRIRNCPPNLATYIKLFVNIKILHAGKARCVIHKNP